jgi:hypothetical protein
MVYEGEKQRYNFETHVSMQRKTHLEIEKTTRQEMIGRVKVKYLMDSLQTPTMDAPKGTMMAMEHLRNAFDPSAVYLCSFLTNTAVHDVRNVASFDQKKKGRSDKGKLK